MLVLSRGGVPGGVLDGELDVLSGCLGKEGIQVKHILPGQGP